MKSAIKPKTATQSLLMTLALFCFVLLPKAQAVSPPPDGCYPNFTTAEGCNALQSLTAGAANTGVGWYALFATSIGSYNTALGAGALLSNAGDQNTAIGVGALANFVYGVSPLPAVPTNITDFPRGGNNVKALKGPLAGSYRYRLGDLRVVYTINDRQAAVLVVTIAKRSDVYG